MLVNNSSRISRLSIGAGTFDPLASSKSTTVKKRPQQRSCQSKDNQHELKLGQRVTVSSLCAIGTIKFIGGLSFKPGQWVGIELDIIGAGKNDGSIKGVRYFDCPAETGLFILANKVSPLKESSSCSSSSTTQSTVTPKKSLTTSRSSTTTSNRRRTKTPSETNSTRRRQQCESNEQQAITSPLKKASLSTSSSTKTPRTPNVTSSLSTRKPSTTKSTKPVSSQRKSATPVMSSPQVSKSTRRTVTPTTKKRQSTKAEPEPLRKSKSTSTRQVVTKDELNKMHVLLEQSRQEKQRLSDEMNGKEAVWERLVTAKESYALKVQEMQVEITRLQDALQLSQQQTAELVQQVGARSSSPSSPSSEGLTGEHHLRRIEKLDRLVREWQQDAQESHQQMQQQQRAHAAQVDQLRRDLAERDQATATMERECESAKQVHSETIQHYECTMAQWTTDHNRTLKSKDDEIDRLHHIIEELKACHFLMPPSPNNEEEDDDHVATYGVTDLNKISSSTIGTMDSNSNMYSSRRRLEQQLELTTLALDDLQQQHRTTAMENDQLRDKLTQMHAASNAVEQQFRQLQNELAVEINDKRLVMEERDAGIQNQLRMEDEHKDLALTNTRLEHQLEQLTDRLDEIQSQLDATQQAHDTMEKECSRLMDDVVDLEEQLQREGGAGTDALELIRLKQQLARQQQQLDQTEMVHRSKVSQLHDDMSQLEALLEKKSFRITELEELYHAEQQKRKKAATTPKQRKKQQQRQQHNHNTTLHHSCSGIIMPLSPISDTASESLSTRLDPTGGDDNPLYCEICEIHGHDVLGCTALIRRQQDLPKNMYCVNCEIYNAHATADCPNQDESF